MNKKYYADLIVVSFYDFMSTHDYFYEFFLTLLNRVLIAVRKLHKNKTTSLPS